MPATARHDSGPPHVPDDDPPATLRFWRQELAPRPGRLAATARLVGATLIVIAISETFQLGDVAFCAYVAILIFKPDANLTLRYAFAVAPALILGIMMPIVLFAATLDAPVLRIPLVAVATFATMVLTKGSRLGQTAYVAGIFVVSNLNDGDDLSGQANSAYYPSNFDTSGLPDALFISAEEALVQNILWMALGAAVAVAVVLAVNYFTAPDPERQFRAALARHIAVAAAFCAGEAGARVELAAHARQGDASLLALSSQAGLAGDASAAVAATSHLALVLLARRRLPYDATALSALDHAMADWASALRACAAAAIAGGTPEILPPQPTAGLPPAAEALLEEISSSVTALSAALTFERRGEDSAAKGAFLEPGAITDPATMRFALKTTLSVMLCYLFMNGTDWPQIGTSMTTCFVLSLETVGQSLYKMLCRIAGAGLGAGLGFLAMMVLTPQTTDIGQLILLLLPPLSVACWVRAGGERSYYVGQQMAYAFMLMILQGYGPTTDYYGGRDRVLGIFVGEIAVTAVFTQLWPVRTADVVRDRVAAALRAVADGFTKASSKRSQVVPRFAAGVGAARGMLDGLAYEPNDLIAGSGRGRIDDATLASLQALAVPLAILARDIDGDDEDRRAIVDWFGGAARWVVGEPSQRGALPQPPATGGHRDGAARAWYDILRCEIGDLIDAVGARARGDRNAGAA